jgi:hypothetical protein
MKTPQNNMTRTYTHMKRKYTYACSALGLEEALSSSLKRSWLSRVKSCFANLCCVEVLEWTIEAVLQSGNENQRYA